MLRTAAVLAARALIVEHGDLGDDFPPATASQRPTALIAILLLGRLDELSLLLDWYEEAVGQLVTRQRQPPHDPLF